MSERIQSDASLLGKRSAITDPTILFVKPKAISAKDKRVLREAGVIVVEIENPADAKLVRAGVELDAGLLLRAAMKAIHETGNHNSPREAFGRAVAVALLGQPTASG